MIASLTQGWVMITPQRCASYAIENHLTASFAYRVATPRHSLIVPKPLHSLRRILLVRNPYRRMESVFRLRMEAFKNHNRDSYSSWVERAVRTVPRCSDFRSLNPSAAIVKVENLKEDLVSLGFSEGDATVPRFHESKWIEPEPLPITDALREWAEPDLTFGYKPE